MAYDIPHGRREPRIPLFVPISATPGLQHCRTLNLSPTGVALTGLLRYPATSIEIGQRLEIEFGLPGQRSPISCVVTVQWVEPKSGRPRASGRLTLGGVFNGLSSPDESRLRLFLAQMKPHVAVWGADANQVASLEEVLAPETNITSAASLSDLDGILSQGFTAAVIICGEATNVERVDSLLGKLDAAHAFIPPALRLEEPQPRRVYWGDGDPAELIGLLNKRRVFETLPGNCSSDQLRFAVQRAAEDYAADVAVHRISVEVERALVRNQSFAPDEASAAEANLVFASEAMGKVLELIRVVARHPVHVLIEGATGTGKERVAEAIHLLGDRAHAPFVAQDCGAMTESLLESELFGHVKGAFTGALTDHPGLFQAANGGTIFLDEIENTTPALQAKLLRVLDLGEVRPVGSAKPRQVDVRIIAASNRGLREEVSAGRFRSDLYYRLATFPIQLPTLRERPEDIGPLARHFLQTFSSRSGKAAPELTAEAEAILVAYDWPGNVRELRNVIQRAVLLTAPGQSVLPETLPSTILSGAWEQVIEAGNASNLKDRLRSVERELIEKALQRHSGSLREVAKELGTSPVTLSRRLKQHGIRPRKSQESS